MSTSALAAGHLASDGQAENADVSVPMMNQSHFIDAKVLKLSIAFNTVTLKR